jgi:ABC-type multidrug transport system permease subunit
VTTTIAYAPNAAVASLVVPLLLGTLVSFAGVLVPYSAINVFWRYWIYYLNVRKSRGHLHRSPRAEISRNVHSL